MLSDEQIKEFREIYKEQFGTEISKEDAYENGIKLLRLMRIICTPVEKKTREKIQKDDFLARKVIIKNKPK